MASPYLGQPLATDDVTVIDRNYFVVRLDDGGLRRVIDRGSVRPTHIWNDIVTRLREDWGDSPVVVWGPSSEGPADLGTALDQARRNGWYLPYAPAPDAVAPFPVEEPVNQYVKILLYREHAARFAHQLDASMGHHTLASADERDRLTTYNALADLIGNAWRKFQEWDEVDPQEIISGGNFDGTLLWKRDEDEYDSVHDYLCGECDIATFARRFILNANLDLFRRIYRQGLVYATNRDVTPWEPRFIDAATNPQSSFYEQLRIDYHRALTHYDHVIGPAEHA